MKISVEMSMYPLTDNAVPQVESFIQRLHKRKRIDVKTNTMSTQVFGEMDEVFRILKEELATSFKEEPTFAVDLKILNKDLNPKSKPFGDKYI